MSKRENHWYLVGNVADAYAKVQLGVLRPRLIPFAKACLLCAGLVLGLLVGVSYWPSETAQMVQLLDTPAGLVLFAAAVVGPWVAWIFWNARRQQARAELAYRRALQHTGPEQLLEVLDEMSRHARMVPDVDAFMAQGKADALTLFGRGDDALRLLGEVRWSAKPPLIRAGGLVSEGLIALLCHRNPRRALDHIRKALDLAALGSAVPGAVQVQRNFRAYAHVCEALLGIQSPGGPAHLEQSLANERFPQIQLLSALGLAAVMDRSGNPERAEQLRRFIRETAPHCAPLQLAPEDFSSSEPEALETGPVSSACEAPEGGVQARSAKKKLLAVVALFVGLLALLHGLSWALSAYYSAKQ